jgi:GT2 family glycosyltransferase
MTVSVLVVTWNNRDTIDGCLASLPEHGIEVLVWDNASADGTAELAERHRALVIRSRVNVGFAAAVNALARHATGDYLLLLNPDARLDAGAIAALLRAADERTVAGAELRGRDGCVQPASGRAFPTPWTLLRPVFLRRAARTAPPARRATTARSRAPGASSPRAPTPTRASSSRTSTRPRRSPGA